METPKEKGKNQKKIGDKVWNKFWKQGCKQGKLEKGKSTNGNLITIIGNLK